MKYNLEKIARRFFPWFWQDPLNLEFIDLFMGSYEPTNQGFFDTEVDYNQRVGYSIQRASLESSLNDRFDNDLRRITIVNGSIGGTEFIFNEAETPAAPQIIYIWNEAETPPNPNTDPFFFNENETGQTAVTGFTVFVPTALTSIENQIKAWIDRVLITSTEYNIVYT